MNKKEKECENCELKIHIINFLLTYEQLLQIFPKKEEKTSKEENTWEEDELENIIGG